MELVTFIAVSLIIFLSGVGIGIVANELFHRLEKE